MKNLKYYKFAILLIFAFVACNEDEWLKEMPLDFYSPENTYRTPEQFNAALTDIYRLMSDATYKTDDMMAMMIGSFADNGYHQWGATHFGWILPESGFISTWWDRYYRIISQANVVIERIDDEKVVFLSENKRSELKAEAMFFRAYSYKCLAILWGGVPIVLEEISVPKRDFTRASREAVLEQAINDLSFAVNNLPEVTELSEEGRITKAAAYHLLSEVYLAAEDWDNAIASSSSVINNPNYALMNERFGKWADRPGDVFRDLFIRDNQNRSTGNTEGIWVGQYEHLVMGTAPSPLGTRFFGAAYWRLRDKNDVPLFFGHSSQNGGRSFAFYAGNDHMDNLMNCGSQCGLNLLLLMISRTM